MIWVKQDTLESAECEESTRNRWGSVKPLHFGIFILYGHKNCWYVIKSGKCIAIVSSTLTMIKMGGSLRAKNNQECR
jgi:hypothetical protein